MIEWFKRFWCTHKWVIIDSSYNDWFAGKIDSPEFKCAHCGKVEGV
jgi:hypothetical protein